MLVCYNITKKCEQCLPDINRWSFYSDSFKYNLFQFRTKPHGLKITFETIDSEALEGLGCN